MTSEVYKLMRACVRGKGRMATSSDASGSRVVDPRDDWYTLCVKAPS
jgi:hypothetical protein